MYYRKMVHVSGHAFDTRGAQQPLTCCYTLSIFVLFLQDADESYPEVGVFTEHSVCTYIACRDERTMFVITAYGVVTDSC